MKWYIVFALWICKLHLTEPDNYNDDTVKVKVLNEHIKSKLL